MLERSPCDGITEEIEFPVIRPSRRRPTGGEQEFATSRHWPEAGMRQRIWVSDDKAHKRVEPAGLREVMRKLQSVGSAI